MHRDRGEVRQRFLALLPRAGRLDEAQRVQLFTGGLLSPLSLAVRIHNLETLAAAMNLARQVELMETDRPVQPSPRQGQRALLAPPPCPAILPPPAATTAAPATSTESRPIRRLSTVEQEERRRLGLCYNCNEKFVRGHNRVCKCLFFMEGALEEEVGDTIERRGMTLPRTTLATPSTPWRASTSATRSRSPSRSGPPPLSRYWTSGPPTTSSRSPRLGALVCPY